MPIFGRKKDVEKGRTTEWEVKNLVFDEKEQKEIFQSEEVKPPEENLKQKIQEEGMKLEKPTFAPLFVKLERYKQILDMLAEIKTTISTIRTLISLLNEVDRVRKESFEVVGNAVEKLEKKLIALDSEFLRPKEFKEESTIETHGTEGLESVISNLKNEVDQLRAELENIS
ncbi:MAG: hypothetical protein QXX38_02330 [Candidatus Aenigmatarchaeota archaeon]